MCQNKIFRFLVLIHYHPGFGPTQTRVFLAKFNNMPLTRQNTYGTA
ncbi:hypothetical protein J2Y03_004453 [Neobacillus niacini]|nr:hypothetical protein [Neobacillus niacini]